jgi:hypothetical protein
MTWTGYTKAQASELLGKWIGAKVLTRTTATISGRDAEKLVVDQDRKLALKTADFD